MLTDDLELHIIKLPKMRKRKANGKDKKLLEWLSFLENPESNEVISYMEKNENMKRAKEKLNTLSANDELRILVELREKAIRDEKSLKEGYYNDGKIDGLKQGRAEGLEQKNKEIAKKLKEKGLSIDFIIEITNLTKEEIEKL